MNLQQSPDFSGRGLLLLSLLLLAALTAVALLTRPLIPVDETRYVSAAWEMWLRGDFLVPFKNGQAYSDKPPLLFWMIHAGWALFGVNDWWPRLVLPVFSGGALLSTCLLARRLWPQHAGLGGRASLVLVSAVWWIIFSTSVMFDVMLAFWVLLGMHGVLRAADGQRRGFVVLGIAVGLGLLTKGPVILLNLLPVTVLAPWWNPGLRWGRWFVGALLAVLLGAVIALAWAIPAGMVGGEEYRNAIFWGQTSDRMVESFAHRRPFWWYLPLLPLLLFPWFAWPALWQALARQRRAGLDRGMRFCQAWMLPVFIAFSFISGKQPHYLLPLFPAFALLAARLMADHPRSRVGLPALLAAALGEGIDAGGQRKDRRRWRTVRRGAAAIAGRGDRAAGRGRLGSGTAGERAGAEPGRAGDPYAGAGANGSDAFIRFGLRHQADGAGDQAVAGRRAAGGECREIPRAIPVSRPPQGASDRPSGGRTGGLWLAAHPEAYVVIYLKDRQKLDVVPFLHKQAYRGGTAVLADAKAAARLLALQRE